MAALKRILSVEDDDDIRSVIEMSLKTVGGYEVKTFASGAEAIASVCDFDPQLILLDVMMPDLDGIDVMSAIRQNESQKEKPVIFMTAKAHPQEHNSLITAGGAAVIPKPFDPLSLPQQINDIWAQLRDQTALTESNDA